MHIRVPLPTAPPHRSRTWSRLLRGTLWLLPVACFLLPLSFSRADLVIFKDGFFLQGQIKQDKIYFVDPISKKGFTVAKLDGFYMVDDGARRIVFSAAQVIDATKQTNEHSADLIRLERISRLQGGKPMPAFWQIESVEPFGKGWERKITLSTSQGRFEMRQRVAELTPRYLRLDAAYWNWTAYYLTQEFGPETIRSLLYQVLDRKTLKVKLTEADKRFQVVRFLLRGGWYNAAEKELDSLLEALPDQKKRVASNRETLKKLRALRLVANLERAHRAGQHREAQSLLAQFAKDEIDAELVGAQRYGRVQGLKAKYRRLAKNVKLARRFLKTVPPRVNEVRQRLVFKEAAAVLAEGLNLDTVLRLDGFIGLALQEERDRERRKPTAQKPEELMALAVSGWLMGNDSAETRVDTALQLWEARRFILAYQQTHELVERRKMIQSASVRPRLGVDEIAQLIRFLPPPEPEEKITTEPVELKTNLPDTRGRGLNYLVQLPPEYHPHRAYPVLFVLHGSRGSPKEMLKQWSDLAGQHGYLLVAPEWSRGQEANYQFTTDEQAAVLDVLRDLRRRFQVDSDRVFLFGFEEGGMMAYDVGLSHPDLFAGVLPMGARPRFFGIPYWTNAQYLPFYVVDGGWNGVNPKENIKQFKDWVRCNYPCLYVEYKGRGGEWLAAELPGMFDWMNVKRRAHPRRALGQDGNGGFFGQEFKTMRAEDNHFYWLSADAVRDGCLNDARAWKGLRRPASLAARIGSDNTVYLGTRGLDAVTIWFAAAAINFEKPVTIRINGPIAWRKRIEPSWETLLEDFYHRGDRHQLFLAKKSFTLK